MIGDVHPRIDGWIDVVDEVIDDRWTVDEVVDEVIDDVIDEQVLTLEVLRYD